MPDSILIDGDLVNFDPAFPPGNVMVKPGKLAAKGAATFNGKKLCVEGDEKNVSVPGCMYTTPIFSIPGTGTLKINSLAPNQKATKTSTGGKKVLLKGAKFVAKFEVQSPAKFQPPGPNPPQQDPMSQYVGTGSFQTTNQKFKGT
jgi:hypothetical protein